MQRPSVSRHAAPLLAPGGRSISANVRSCYVTRQTDLDGRLESLCSSEAETLILFFAVKSLRGCSKLEVTFKMVLFEKGVVSLTPSLLECPGEFSPGTRTSSHPPKMCMFGCWATMSTVGNFSLWDLVINLPRVREHRELQVLSAACTGVFVPCWRPAIHSPNLRSPSSPSRQRLSFLRRRCQKRKKQKSIC